MNMKNKFYVWGIVLITVIFFIFSATNVNAHPGNTASDGCHYCRTNCDKWGVAWDERHCHGRYSTPYTTPYATPYITPPVATPISQPPAEVQGTQTQNDDGSFWTGLITLGILGGGLYWVIKKIKNAPKKDDNEENKEI